MTAIDYAARFEGFGREALFEVEDSREEPDDAREYVEQLAVVLADWRRELAAKGLDNIENPEGREYSRCLRLVCEAFFQWHFWGFSKQIPFPLDLPQAVAR